MSSLGELILAKLQMYELSKYLSLFKPLGFGVI